MPEPRNDAAQNVELARHDERIKTLEAWSLKTDERMHDLINNVARMTTNVSHLIKVAYAVLIVALGAILRSLF